MQESNQSLFQTNESEKDLEGMHSDRQMAQQSTNLELLMTLGMMHVQQEQWKPALNCYQQALELHPNNEQVQLQLAVVLERLGEKDAAIEHYFQALSLNSTLFSVADLYRFAAVLQQGEQYDRALSCYQWALQQQQTPDIYRKIAELLANQAQYELAVSYYQQAIDLEPSWQDYHNLGYTLSKLEQWETAAQAYRQATQLNPTFPWSHNNLGDMLVQLQQWDDAIQAYQQAIAIDSKFHWAYCNLGELYAKQGDLEKAISHHRQSILMRGWQEVTIKSYCFKNDWFTHNIPTWKEHLLPLANHELNTLEIGSYEGMATCWLLDYVLTHQAARITCIDLNFQENFDINIQRTGVSHKVTKIPGNSHEILPTLTPESFDLIYVDGCHLADHTRHDAFLSWKLLKLGGLMIFDDYEWSDPNCPGQDPKIGFDVFLDSVKFQFEILHKGYQMIVKKILEN